MKFGHIEVPCDDPAATSLFYQEQLGFTLEVEQGGRFFWLQRDGVSFLLRPVGQADAGHVLVFYTQEAEAEAGRVRDAGVNVRLGSDNCHHFRDPSGHHLQIVNPSEDHSG